MNTEKVAKIADELMDKTLDTIKSCNDVDALEDIRKLAQDREGWSSVIVECAALKRIFELEGPIEDTMLFSDNTGDNK